MKNVVGQTPRGKDFFPRDKIIKKIYRRLESGSHVFLAAPRRVGKTSIMRYLEDNPKEGFQFVYVITESAQSPEEYYQKLLEEILKSSALSKLAKRKESISTLIKSVLERLESIKFPWLEVNMEKRGKETFQAAFEKLIAEYEGADEVLVIMADEYPQTVENIKLKYDPEEAKRFLRINREQRQQASDKIRFIYTGSIGLPTVVKKLTSTSVINDLNVIEIPPLSDEEATQFVKLLLGNYGVPYQPEMIEDLLGKIKWLIPFHIQLAVQELIDVYEMTEEPLGKDSVDKAFSQLLNIRNDIYFEHYYIRLKSAFSEKQYKFAINLLDVISDQDTTYNETVLEIAHKNEVSNIYESVIESLIYDGYIHFDSSQKFYRFNSYLLQQWWQKKNPQ